jgi:WD40 repeat protein
MFSVHVGRYSPRVVESVIGGESDDQNDASMEVLKNLSENEVTALRERFAEPLAITEFEQVLTEFVARMPNIDLQRLRLHELFNDIDANGDKTVSWDEFTMFLIDAAALEATLVTSGRDAVIKQYRPVATLKDEVPGSVSSIRYIKEIGKVVKVVQRDKYSKIRLCHPGLTLPVWMEIPRSDSAVLAYDYIPAKPSVSMSNVLCVSTNDNVVRYHDVSRHTMSSSTVIKCRRSFPVPESQTAVHWDNEHSKLLLGSRSGVVSVVNPDDVTPVNTERIHETVITAMLTNNGTLYSASLDSSIKLVDLHRGIVRHTIEGPLSHQQGVFRLAMSTNSQQLFSVGLEPTVYVHSLSNNKMRPQKLIDKNRPHHGRIVSLHVLSDSPQVISGDSSGLVKIWDSRTLSCVQTISTVKDDVFKVAQMGGALLSSVGYVEKNKHLVINGRSTKIFGYDTASNPHLSDDTACTLVVFNPLSRTFLTVHRSTIKLWDGQTGSLRGVHTNVTESDITAVCLAAPRMRKFILGTLTGEQQAFGYAMCTPIGDAFPKGYTTPTASIVAMWYLDGFKENRNQYVLTVYKREVALIPDADESITRSVIPLHCFHEPLQRHAAKALAVTENRTVLLATEASTVYVCDLGNFTLTCVIQPTGLTGDVTCLIAFPDTNTPFISEGREAAGHATLNDSCALTAHTSVAELPLSVAPARHFATAAATVTAALQQQPFFRRLGTGIAFVSDSAGSIAAVLMHSAQAMETIVTWKNIEASRRRKQQRHRHRHNPHLSPKESTLKRVVAAELASSLIAVTSEGSMTLQPAHSLAVGDVVNMAEVQAPPLSIDDHDDDDGKGDGGGDEDSFSGSDSESGDDTEQPDPPGASRRSAKDGGPATPTRGAKRRATAAGFEESIDAPPDVNALLGSRPNSAVAAYFQQDAPDSTTSAAATRQRQVQQPKTTRRHKGQKIVSYTPVITALCFIADGHVLVTGDENGYVTTWDVDLVVRKAARHAAKIEDDTAASPVMPVPIASWRAHSDEIVAISEAFGERDPAARDGAATGAVIATASIDRNIVLWTTDGVSLGNLAQGRIADDKDELPEGIQPYVLDDPPANAWALTDKIRLQREVLARMADVTREGKMQALVASRLPAKPPSSTQSSFSRVTPGSGGGGVGALATAINARLAERAAGARTMVGGQGSSAPTPGMHTPKPDHRTAAAVVHHPTFFVTALGDGEHDESRGTSRSSSAEPPLGEGPSRLASASANATLPRGG